MSRGNGKLFDNVGVRTRGVGCAVFSVHPPFTLACWPESRTVLSALGLHEVCLQRPQDQARFLTALAERSEGVKNSHPARIGFRSSRGVIQRREAFRRNYRRVVFLGKCSRQVVLAAVELASSQVNMGGNLDIQVKGWDLLADWECGSERLRDWSNYLGHTARRRATVTVFSEFRALPEELWKLVYDCPNVRLAWRADALGDVDDMASFRPLWETSLPARNLRTLVEAGFWPHIVLPVTEANAGILCDLVAALLGETRGASLELIPLPFLPPPTSHEAGSPQLRPEPPANRPAPPVTSEHVKSLLAACRHPRIPRDLVAPLSWVAARLNSGTSMISSPVAAGVELAVLADGDIYAGECAAGVERWRLGNVLDDPATVRWERLDALPEMFSPANTPARCQACDWRYRCGGADASVFLLPEQLAGRKATPHKPLTPSLSPSDGERVAGGAEPCQFDALFELYCAPRKALFEEMLWSSVDAGLAGKQRPAREILELQPDGIIFRTAPTPNQRFPDRASGVAASEQSPREEIPAGQVNSELQPVGGETPIALTTSDGPHINGKEECP